jgi:hypothetical protein
MVPDALINISSNLPSRLKNGWINSVENARKKQKNIAPTIVRKTIVLKNAKIKKAIKWPSFCMEK